MTFDTHLKFSLYYLADFHKKGALVFRAYNKTSFKTRVPHMNIK